MSEIVLAFFRN